MMYGEFKPVTKNKKTIGFISCEKAFIGFPKGSLFPIFRGYKQKLYLDRTMQTIEAAFDSEAEARQWIKSEK